MGGQTESLSVGAAELRGGGAEFGDTPSLTDDALGGDAELDDAGVDARPTFCAAADECALLVRCGR